MKPNPDLCSEEKLLNDLSIDWSGIDRRKILSDLDQEPPLTKLKHPEVRFEVTDHCNAECIMRPRDKHKMGREHGVMDMEKYRRSVDEVVSIGAKRAVLQGFGEPLVDKRLENKIAYAKSKGLHTYTITNASLLTPSRSRSIIEAGLDEIRFSFYGMSKASYNTVMRRLDFDTTVKAILGFLEERAKLGSKLPKTEMTWLVMKETEHETDQFREFWEPKVDAIEIWKPHNYGDGRSYRNRRIDPSIKKTCGRPENGPLQIQWNGEIVPCCYDYNNQIVLGNVFESSVLDVLNGRKYRLLRWAHRSCSFGAFPYCDQCDQLLPHAEALVYTNRHKLPAEVAVRMSNTDLYDLQQGGEFDAAQFQPKYAEGLNVEPKK